MSVTRVRPSPYKENIFSPVTEEQTFENLEVIGEIPSDLQGMFLRNGPNPRYEARGRYHWFDGDGMIHGLHIEEGKAVYRNRYVRTNHFEREGQAGDSLWTGILEPMDQNNPDGPDKNTANTDLVWHNGRLLSLWWLGGQPYVVDLPELETRGALSFSSLEGNTIAHEMAAHPKVDPRTGEMMFINYSLYKEPYLEYGVVGANGELKHFTPIDLPGPRLLHDIAITENYTIFLDTPMLWKQEKMKTGKRQVIFDDSLPARFGVIPRMGSNQDVRWFECPPCYAFHCINAYEDGDEIVFQACRIENPTPRTRQELQDDTVPKLFFLQLIPYMHRWRFNLKTGESREEQLDDAISEFPRINESRMGQKIRYSYNSRLARQPQMLFEALIKYDLEEGTNKIHEYGPGRYGCEAVFASRPGATEEDDGWMLSYIYDQREDKSELLVMDAKNLDSDPVARILIPTRIPIGFHAWWVDRAEIDAAHARQ